MSEYPSEKELVKVTSWKVNNQNDFLDLMEYIHGFWAYAGDGYWERKGDMFVISTAGWSGNEEIITALQKKSNILDALLATIQTRRTLYLWQHTRLFGLAMKSEWKCDGADCPFWDFCDENDCIKTQKEQR